ncbi:TonB-dependent receptor [Granulicella mallensis]|uniref:TonB-dependent receptor n=1 Tax=Granulicella mallensis TaxID=940614 RepID=UPI001CBCC1B3|nr:TonB-dependent receptor [Granulicella mallensis]
MKRLFLLVVMACLVLSSAPMFAQFETASVLGYVRDGSGAVVPGASVSLINQETKAVVKAQTSAQGSYEFVDVKIGQYLVTAQANGFDVSTTQPFTVTVNARQRVDLALTIGSTSETVTVDSAAVLLETDSSERGQVIGTREVQNLPLNGRAYADLAALVPGVRRSLLENGTDSSRDASFNVNGMRSEQNNFLLDGLDNNSYGTSNQGFSNQALPPSPDAIDEFKVQTDNYSAEFGRAPGAVINVSIKSGTNHFHGAAYDYLRNTALNAIGPFSAPINPLTGKSQKPTLQRNQFGGTFGGPIFKDKLFFFGDYEGTRQVVHAINTATVPDADQNGTSAQAIANGGYTFLTTASSTLGIAANTPVQIKNPITGQVYTNGVVPFSDPTVSSFAKGVLAALPAPNLSGIVSNNYISLPADTLNDDKGDIRVDYTISPKTTMFARYSEHQGNIFSPPNIQGPAGGNSNGFVYIFNQQVAGGVTHAFTPNSILDARFAFTRTDGGKSPYGHSLASLESGIAGLPTSGPAVTSLNAQSVQNFSQFGSLSSNPQFQDPYTYNPKINYTWIKGRSTYKAGYEYVADFTTDSDFNPAYGEDTYNEYFSANGYISAAHPGVTTGTTSSPSGFDTGSKEGVALSDFLFGARDTYQLDNNTLAYINQRFHFFYFQDDIRFSSKLTINAGLRYELVTPQWESSNHLSNFDPGTVSMVNASNGSIYNRALVHMPKLDFAPRLGLAYQIDSKTVVRAGYGIGFLQFNRQGGENVLVYNAPFVVDTVLTQAPEFGNLATSGSSAPLAPCTTAQAALPYSSTNPTPCFRTSAQGYTTGMSSPANVTAASYKNTEVRYLPPNLPTGYVQSYHLTVQRELGPSTTFEVAYVGEHGVKIQTLADLNQANPATPSATCSTTITSGCGNLAARRPIQSFYTIEETIPAGFLTYNALQTKLEHRSGHGLYLLNSFTYSQAIDNSGGNLEANNGDSARINLANPRNDRGPSGYNQPLNDTLSIVYDLPYGKGRTFGGNAPAVVQQVLGGWQVTAINDMNSGQPFNISYSPTGVQSVSSILTQRPNQTGPAVLPKSKRVKTSTSYSLLNPASFSLPAFNQPYGNAGRNSARLDPFYQLDLGLHKQFDVFPRENIKFDFRTEAFNVLNKVNYEGPANETFGNSAFGLATSSTVFPARILQFAGKIIF